MAIEQNLRTCTYPAAADLSAKQFYAVSGDEVNGVNVATAAKNMTGILQNKPTANQAASIATDGQTKAAITASSNVAAGGLLEVDTGGTLKAIASGTAVARAEQATNTAAVTIIPVTILRSNALFS
jgi:hypothetical protein